MQPPQSWNNRKTMVLYFYTNQQRMNTINSQNEYFLRSLMLNKYAIWKVQKEKIDNLTTSTYWKGNNKYCSI